MQSLSSYEFLGAMMALLLAHTHGTNSPGEDHRPTVIGAAKRDKVRFAREQRRAPTHAEDALWGELRGAKLGWRFRRQHPIGDFVLDFYCSDAGLAIEIDGPTHAEKRGYDEWRDEQLAARGIRTLRLDAELVSEDLSEALKTIRAALTPGSDGTNNSAGVAPQG